MLEKKERKTDYKQVKETDEVIFKIRLTFIMLYIIKIEFYVPASG